MNRLLFLIALELGHLVSHAQSLPTDEPKKLVAYGEFVGAGYYYSLNAEYPIWKKGELSLYGRAGFGILPKQYQSPMEPFEYGDKYVFFSIPVGVSGVFWEHRKGHLELGLSVSYLRGRSYADNVGASKNIFMYPSVGYRYQRPSGGFFGAFRWTPYLTLAILGDYPYPPGQNHWVWFGISAGYAFPLKN